MLLQDKIEEAFATKEESEQQCITIAASTIPAQYLLPEILVAFNEKYPNQEYPIFHFIYRERKFNKSENKYLGWERKRGLLTQFNEYILKHQKNKFKINTINQENLPQIKYVITLDSDTDSSPKTKGKTFDSERISTDSGYISTCPVGYFSL